MTHEVERESPTATESLLTAVERANEATVKELAKRLPIWRAVRTADAFMTMEREIHDRYRALADEVSKSLLAAIVGDDSFQRETNEAVRKTGLKYKNGGRRSVTVTLLGGSATKVKVPYFRPDISGRPGPKRGHGRRGKGGAGVYPALVALGICFGATPAAASEVCKQVTASESVRAGRIALASRKLDLGHKQTLRLVEHVGHRMLAQRDEWLAQIRMAPPATGPLAGKHVVIATDGGRLRERRQSGRGRKRADTGHRKYETPWREPKLFVIYVVDEDGKVDRAIRPVYDGTLGDCNATFEMLLGYLQALGAGDAKKLTVVGDGARWIWDRIDDLVTQLGIASDRVHQVIDWSHALSTLYKIVDYAKNWTQSQRDSWIRTAKALLHAGKIEQLLAHLDDMAVGRRAKKVGKHRDYFKHNAERMQYATCEATGIPTGSGAIESAIRCVINQRLKGCGKFWKERNAEAMILLRSYLKAERFDDLFAWSIAQATPWWQQDTPYAHSPVVPDASLKSS